MILSDFQSAVKGETRFSDFFLAIKNEVDAYRDLISSDKKGITIPIHVEEDVDSLTLTASHVKNFEYCFLNKEINVYELSYLADALTLCETVTYDNEASKEAVFSFTDSEINGEITYGSVQKTIREL